MTTPVEFVGPRSLSMFGIEEIDPNTCEDTSRNRAALRKIKIPFWILEPGVLEVELYTPEELNPHHTTMYAKYSELLVDPKNPWSDYVSMLDLPLSYMEVAPAWISRTINEYNDAIAHKLPASKVPVIPGRCKRKRADGSRCWGWGWPHLKAEGFCRHHVSNATFNASVQMGRLSDAAKMRLSQLSEPALLALEDLVINSPVPQVRLKAATEILDRMGIRGGSELTVSGTVQHEQVDPAEAVRKRLADMASKPELEAAKELDEDGNEIVEAEVVES